MGSGSGGRETSPRFFHLSNSPNRLSDSTGTACFLNARVAWPHACRVGDPSIDQGSEECVCVGRFVLGCLMRAYPQQQHPCSLSASCDRVLRIELGGPSLRPMMVASTNGTLLIQPTAKPKRALAAFRPSLPISPLACPRLHPHLATNRSAMMLRACARRPLAAAAALRNSSSQVCARLAASERYMCIRGRTGGARRRRRSRRRFL